MEAKLRWLHARDVFLGDNFERRDSKRGLELMRECYYEEPDAREICDALVCVNANDVVAVSNRLEVHTNPRMRVYLCCIWGPSVNNDKVRLAAQLGHAFSMWYVSAHVIDLDMLRKAADAGEPRAMGLLFRLDAVPQSERALNLKRAAEHGWVSAMSFYSETLSPRDMLHYEYKFKAHSKGCFVEPQFWLTAQTRYFDGMRFKRHPTQFLGVRDVNAAMIFFDEQQARVRATIDAWVGVARRLHVVKDIRRLVSDYIWAERAWTNY